MCERRNPVRVCIQTKERTVPFVADQHTVQDLDQISSALALGATYLIPHPTPLALGYPGNGISYATKTSNVLRNE